VTPKDLKQCSHQQLRAKGRQFGPFYTRLPDPEPPYRPARLIQPPNRPGYVSGEGLGLSSPLGTEKHGHSQSSSFSLSDGDPAEKTDNILRTKHETVTAGMAASRYKLFQDCHRSLDYQCCISRQQENPTEVSKLLLIKTCQIRR
jgi:hypothetical protein